MNVAWFNRPDWPMDWELKRRADLMEAIKVLEHADAQDAQRIEGMALLLFITSMHASDAELPRNRQAALKASQTEMRDLMALCEKLRGHIENMHQPAVSALMDEGAKLFTFASEVAQMAEIAGISIGSIDAKKAAKGAKSKIVAAQVTEMAAHLYEDMTGRHATYTTHSNDLHPSGPSISGQWLTFLKAIFQALNIQASVEAQTKIHKELNTRKTSI
jgi:predicted O-linked N-acetylglucosamine transferase (SPINDLY family)